MNTATGLNNGRPSIKIRPDKKTFRLIKQTAQSEGMSMNLFLNRVICNYFNEVNPV